MLGGALEGTREVPDKTRACKWRAERRDVYGARVFLDAFTKALFLSSRPSPDDGSLGRADSTLGRG